MTTTTISYRVMVEEPEKAPVEKLATSDINAAFTLIYDLTVEWTLGDGRGKRAVLRQTTTVEADIYSSPA